MKISCSPATSGQGSNFTLSHMMLWFKKARFAVRGAAQ